MATRELGGQPAQVQTTGTCRERWRENHLAYEAARARFVAAGLASAAQRPTVPEGLGHMIVNSPVPVPRWLDEVDLASDPTLTKAEQALIRPALAAFRAQERGPERDEREPEADTEIDLASDAMEDAFKALVATPVPDVAALLTKLRIVMREADDDRIGIAVSGALAYSLHRDPRDALAAHLYRDLCGLTGQDGHVQEAAEFDPDGWVGAYEQVGGIVTARRRELVLRIPDVDHRGIAEGLRAELSAAPWKFFAVMAVAERRLDAGGDPIFTKFYHLRPEVAHRLPFARALRVSFSRDGDDVRAHVVEVDNRAAVEAEGV